ncbi:TPA: 30S ribosomal protein S19e [Candidatus Bathyarchaeota archaeon]|nr:30S ribosomal protein S19e [Candidatus Bathyarchaeota archaeon]
MSVREVPPDLFIERLAGYLKRRVEAVSPPPWAPFVKTGVHKERPPQSPDWWYTRCASLLRKLYVKGPSGVSRLRKVYGGKRRMGVRPPHFRRASGAIIRHALQQLEDAGLVRSADKGRELTSEGRSLLEKIAIRIKRELAKERRKKKG